MNQLRKKSSLLIYLLFILIFTFDSSSYEAAAKAKQYTTNDIEKIIDGVLSYKQKQSKASSTQELIDNEFSMNAGKGSMEWCVIALSQYKMEYDYSKYIKALNSYVENNKSIKPTDLQRVTLAYSAVGENEPFIKATLKNTIGELGIMSYIYGLILMDSREYPEADYNREDILEEILALKLPDGGWAIGGKASDVDITAMVLQALAPYYEDGKVKATIDKALELLSKQQLENGDFKSWGTRSCESTAQVITALSALGIDCQKDSRFIKNKKTIMDGMLLYKKSDGSFSHTIDGKADNTASVQAMYSMVAYWRLQNKLDRFYIFSKAGITDIQDNKPVTDLKDLSEIKDKSGALARLTEKNNVSNYHLLYFVLGTFLLLIAICVALTARHKIKKYRKSP